MLTIKVTIEGDNQTEVVETANNQFISEGYSVVSMQTDNQGMASMTLQKEEDDNDEIQEESFGG